jgi:hypothetical protein
VRRGALSSSIASLGLLALLALADVARADSGLEGDATPLRPMGGAMLSSELQLEPSGELWVGYGRFGDWVASLQVPMFYDVDNDFFGYGMHAAYRLWPQVLGGKIFLEPNLGITSGQTNGERDNGLGLGLSFGYTFLVREHLALSGKAGFDIAPVAPRGFFGLEVIVY